MQPELKFKVRGVQWEQVWAAADALLSAGERPTIEKVRMRLGTGSPNTVGPMLDSWYGALGKRLKPAGEGGVAEVADGNALNPEATLPAPVLRAMRLVWGRAVQQAQEVAQSGVSKDRDDLAVRESALDALRDDLALQARRMEDRAAGLTAALQAKDTQIAAQAQHIESLERLMEQRLQEATIWRSRHEDALGVVQGLRNDLQTQAREARTERERLEQRAIAQERRWLEELDRTRVDAKRVGQALADKERQWAETQSADRAATQRLAAELAEANVQRALQESALQLARDEVQTAKLQSAQQARETSEMLKELQSRLPRTRRLQKPGWNRGS